MPRKKDEDAAAAAELFVDNGGRKPWSGQERTAMARMEEYVNNSEYIQLEIDGGVLVGPGVLGRRREAYFKKCDKGRQETF